MPFFPLNSDILHTRITGIPIEVIPDSFSETEDDSCEPVFNSNPAHPSLSILLQESLSDAENTFEFTVNSKNKNSHEFPSEEIKEEFVKIEIMKG